MSEGVLGLRRQGNSRTAQSLELYKGLCVFLFLVITLPLL